MRRLAHAILAAVVLFVLVVAATLYARTRTARDVEPVGPAPPVKADLHVKEVRIEEEAGKVRWRLTAEQALLYDEKGTGRTELRRVNVEVAEPERTWLVGDDPESDIRGAKLFGMRTALVRTGKFRPDTLDGIDLAPDVVLSSVADLPAWLEAQ